MGWKLNALLLIIGLWSLGNGILVVGVPALLYLSYSIWSGRQRKPAGLGRSRWMIYLGAFLVVLSLMALGAGGTYSPVVFGLSGLALLALGVFPGLVQEFVENFSGPASELFRALWGRKRAAPELLPCVELTKLPLNYLDAKKNDPKETLQRFQRLVQTLAELGFPVELRLEFSGGAGRILFSAPGREARQRIQGLMRVARSQLPEFGAETVTRPAAEDPFSVPVEGVPQPSLDPVGPLARYFVENRLDGAYSVVVSPAWVNPFSRWSAGRRQRKVAESAGYQHVDDDRTTTVVDHPKQVELEDAAKGLDRLLARRPVRVSVLVAAGDESTAEHAASVLAGALSSQRSIDGLKVRRPQVKARAGWRRSALMLPSEAAPYFWLPQVSMGVKVAPSAEFHAPPLSEGEVVLGEVVGLSGKSGQQVRIGRDDLAKHVFVTGMTGSGKSTSCFGLLLQLDRMEVPFLVIEPVKSEYRSLLAAIPGLQVFTVGDEGTAPFRLNIFEPPPGVKVQAHLESLASVWNGSFVSYAPVPYVVPQVFAEAYRACGWDLETDRRGRPVTFDDVTAAVRMVVRGLEYEPRVTMDVEAAIMVRLNSLRSGGKRAVFGALTSTPLEAVMSRPTVVELKSIQSSEEKAFVATLLMTNVAGFVRAEGQSSSLRHFTLIEEAHRLHPKVSTEKVDPEATDPRRVKQEQFRDMLAELRAYGEGLAVVEQSPTDILPGAIKNTATKVVHRVPHIEDRRVMAGAMNATKEQAAVFTALRPGEAVVSIEGHPVPVRVQVEDVVTRLGIPVRETTDEDVKRQMAGFYGKHPLLEGAGKPLDERMKELVDSEEFRDGFLRAYRAWARLGEAGPLRDLLLQSAAGLSKDRADLVERATRILSLAVAFYLPFDADQRARFPELFRKELEHVRA